MTARDAVVRCWKLAEWPAGDQAAWALGCTPGDPFDDEARHGATLRPDTLRKLAKGYGRWLCFLDGRGWLDPGELPLARATPERRWAYFRHLRETGNADYTVIGRFTEPRMTLRIMAPGEDVSRVCRLGSLTVYVRLQKALRPVLVPGSDVLFTWALEMMDAAREATVRCKAARLAYRDGVLLAMLACRGRRLRSMSLLRVGREVIRADGCYRVELAPEQVKTNRHDRFDLPAELTGRIEHYLTAVRPTLLGNGASDAFWISARGGPCTAKAIQMRVFTLTSKRFGVAFGPHRFRHAIATTASLAAPECPGLAAGLLGISAEVVEGHYNRAGQSQAAQSYAALIERLRDQVG